MTNNIIKIKNFKKKLRRPPPDEDFELDIEDLEVETGTFSAIIGRNGSGKTTLLNCISGLSSFQEGEIQINIRNLKNTNNINDGTINTLKQDQYQLSNSVRKNIGYVFQDMALWPHFSVFENVVHPLVHVHNKDDAINTAKYWLNELGVDTKYWKQKPQGLSGGFRRRVAIARTLAINPLLLLIDEIEANLDPEAMDNVLMLLENHFIRPADKTVLMVTHQISLVMRLADKVIVLDDGILTIDESPRNVFNKPIPEIAEKLRNAIEITGDQFMFGSQCLEGSINITAKLLKSPRTKENIIQAIAEEVLKLISRLEPKSPHLVLIVDKNISDEKFMIKGLAKSKEFILDGRHIFHLGDKLVVKSNNAKCILKEDYKDHLASIDETSEEFMVDFENSAIDQIYRIDKKEKEQLHRMSGNNKVKYESKIYMKYGKIKINNVLHCPVGIIAKQQATYVPLIEYYEFSKNTANLYLFPLRWHGEVLGVLSIDTYSEKIWEPLIIEQLKLVAEISALAININKLVGH